MLFISHDDDGRIEQVNKVFDYEGYADKLRDAGHTFVQNETMRVISPNDFFVSGGEVLQKRPMPITLDRDTIKAGSSESAVFRGIPRESRVQIWAVGELLHDLPQFGSDELEIKIPVPCSYVVKVILFPFLDYSRAIEAVQ